MAHAHRRAHQEFSWSCITWLESSSAVLYSKRSNPQLHFHKHQRTRQTAHELSGVTGPSQQCLFPHRARQHLEEAEARILCPLRGSPLQEVQHLSSYATISRVFAHLACRYRGFLIDKFETAFKISLVHNYQSKLNPTRSDQCFT